MNWPVLIYLLIVILCMLRAAIKLHRLKKVKKRLTGTGQAVLQPPGQVSRKRLTHRPDKRNPYRDAIH